MLLDYKASPNSKQNYGETPLHYSVIRDDKEMAFLLLSYSASPNNIDSMTGRSPLHYAVINQCVEIIKLLVAFGADIEIEDVKGKTPISLAQKRGIEDLLYQTRGTCGIVAKSGLGVIPELRQSVEERESIRL